MFHFEHFNLLMSSSLRFLKISIILFVVYDFDHCGIPGYPPSCPILDDSPRIPCTRYECAPFNNVTTGSSTTTATTTTDGVNVTWAFLEATIATSSKSSPPDDDGNDDPEDSFQPVIGFALAALFFVIISAVLLVIKIHR
jgi:hypothetical protein